MKKVVDAGVEMRANRRREAPVMTLEAFGQLNETQKARNANKASLWPQPRWLEMSRVGYSAQRLLMVKRV